MTLASAETRRRTEAVRTIAVDALTGEELDAWHRLRAANPKLDSPY